MAGTIITVMFGEALSATPVSVVVSSANTTAGATTNLDVGALAMSKTGFSIYAAGSAITSDTYLIQYSVLKSRTDGGDEGDGGWLSLPGLVPAVLAARG